MNVDVGLDHLAEVACVRLPQCDAPPSPVLFSSEGRHPVQTERGVGSYVPCLEGTAPPYITWNSSA